MLQKVSFAKKFSTLILRGTNSLSFYGFNSVSGRLDLDKAKGCGTVGPLLSLLSSEAFAFTMLLDLGWIIWSSL